MDNLRSLHDLRRYWDDLVLGKPASPGQLDPESAAFLQRLHTLPGGRPDPAYATDLREKLMHTATYPLAPPTTPSLNGRLAPDLSGLPIVIPVGNRRIHSWPLTQAAIVLLIIAAMVVTYFVTLRPHSEPTFAPAVGTPVPAGNSDDWPMFKANPARTSLTAGSGPQGQPVAVWTYHAGGSAARSPAIAGSVVYLQTGDGMVTALDAPTGQVLWQNADTGTVENTPAVAGETLYLTTISGELVALDRATGAEQWRFGERLAPEGMPIVVDGVVYMGSDDNKVYAINGATGKALWNATISGPLWRSLTIGGGLIFAGTSNGHVDALDLATGESRWQFTGDDETQSIGTPTFANGALYINYAGAMHALDAATGTERWQRSFPGSRPAAAVGDMLISTSADGGIYAIDAARGDDQWMFDTGEDVNAPPAVADGVVYVASQEGSLFALDQANGAERWRFALDGAVTWGPSIADGMLFTGTESGTLYAIGGDGTQQLSAPLAATSATPEPEATNGVVAGEGPAIAAISLHNVIMDPTHPFHAPGGAAEAKDGTLYVVDVVNNQVQRFDRDGNPIGIWGGQDDPEHDFSFGNDEGGYGDIRIGADGAIYIVEQRGARVQKLSPDGTVLTSWGERGAGEGQFSSPNTLTIAPDGSIMVVDSGNHRIQVFDENGNFLRMWGKSGDAPGSLIFPWSVVVRPNSTYLVSDVGNQVFAYDQEGNYLGTALAGDGPNSDKDSAYDLEIDTSGNLFLGDYRDNRLTILAPDFTALASWGKKGSGDGEFDGLAGFALGQNGRVIVSDEGNNRVEVFQIALPLGIAAATPTP